MNLYNNPSGKQNIYWNSNQGNLLAYLGTYEYGGREAEQLEL